MGRTSSLRNYYGGRALELPILSIDACLCPNCAIGNPVVAKHASIVPQCAEAFERLILDAGAPKGVWTNLFISSDQVADIIADPRVQGVALTGSEGAGRAVAGRPVNMSPNPH